MKILIALTIAGLPLLAQSTPSNEWDKEGQTLGQDCGGLFQALSELKSCAVFLFHDGKPVSLSIPQSVVPGGGTAIGAQYVQPLDIPNWAESNFTLEGGSSLREFWYANAIATFGRHAFGGRRNGARDAFQLKLYATTRDLPLMPFYGIGPNTQRSNLADFKQRDINSGISIFNPMASWLAIGGLAEFYSTKVGGVRDPGVTSIDTAFTGATAPGLSHQPGFVHYSVFAQPRATWTRTSIYSRVGFDGYQDPNSRYTTRKFHAEYLQKIYPESQTEPTNGGASTRTQPRYDSVLYIAGRFVHESAPSGEAVPFYLQDTIGGSDIDGVPTLRGFQDYRFRGPNLAVIQTQFERRLLPPTAFGSNPSTFRKVAGALGIMAFYDVGAVALKASDLSLSHMRQSFGFGLTFWSGEKVWFRAYVGLGSGEGVHNFFGITDPGAPNPHL